MKNGLLTIVEFNKCMNKILATISKINFRHKLLIESIPTIRKEINDKDEKLAVYYDDKEVASCSAEIELKYLKELQKNYSDIETTLKKLIKDNKDTFETGYIILRIRTNIDKAIYLLQSVLNSFFHNNQKSNLSFVSILRFLINLTNTARKQLADITEYVEEIKVDIDLMDSVLEEYLSIFSKEAWDMHKLFYSGQIDEDEHNLRVEELKNRLV